MDNKNEEPSIKVTRIGNRWHSRLFIGKKLVDEMACELKCDIGWICREMLRWQSTMGFVSDLSDAARDRHKSNSIGKVWYIGLYSGIKKRYYSM